MPKKIKEKRRQQQMLKSNQTNLKGVKKHEKTRFKHDAKQCRVKNKRNIGNSVVLTKTKPNVMDNVKSKENIKDIKIRKKDKFLKRLNVSRLNTMLQEKEKATGEVKKKKLQEAVLSLRERMIAQLKASRFRYLNEQLYNSNSLQSKKYFEQDPDAFYAYHEGYKHQVKQWPMNPLDVIIESIKKMPKEHVIVDFGCGEAKLADSLPQTVHSFDLIAVNDKVKACDMANTPLLTGRADVVVFCLSLMGTNLGDYLLEANRVLAKNGILKIAEVESRFDKIDDFIKVMTSYGFLNTLKDLSNNIFYFLDFKKFKDVVKKDSKKLPALILKPCLYKKR